MLDDPIVDASRELLRASARVAPAKTDDELRREVEDAARFAGIKLRRTRPPTDREKSQALHERITAQVRLELRAEAAAAMNAADERLWAAKRIEQHIEQTRKDTEKLKRDAEQLRRDAEYDRQFARKAQEEARAAAVSAARDLASAETARREVADQLAKSAESVKGMRRAVAAAEERASKAESEVTPAVRQAAALLAQARECAICSTKPLTTKYTER